LFPHARVVTLIPIFFFFVVRELPAIVFIVIWFVLQLMSGVGSLHLPGEQGGIAFFAHIGGFLAGLVLVTAFAGPRNRSGGFRRSYAAKPYDRERRWDD
jgi:rhomboid family protein